MFFWLQFEGGICSFLTSIFFYPPEVDHPLVVPYGVPLWSLSVLYQPPSRCFFDFNLQAVSAHFWPLYFFIVVMGDDGWMDGWVPKMFSDFAQIFFRWSSGDINVRKFGKSAKNFFYRKKIQLQLSKSGDFWNKFRMGNRCFFWKFSVFVFIFSMGNRPFCQK